MNWRSNSPPCRLSTSLAGLAVLAAGNLAIAGEMANSPAVEDPVASLADRFSAELPVVAPAAQRPVLFLAWVDFAAEPGQSSAARSVDPISLSDVAGDTSSGGEDRFTADLASQVPEWMPAPAELAGGPAMTLGAFLPEPLSRHAGQGVWNSEIGGEFSTEEADVDRILLLEKQLAPPKGYIINGVADALEEFTEPSPDFLVIVVLALQSLWAITRPRQK